MDGQGKETSKRSATLSTTDNIKCGNCARGPEHDNLVLCDKCENWYHYSCVGVDASVMERDWRCKKCETVEVQSKVPPQQEPIIQIAGNENSTGASASTLIDNQFGIFSNPADKIVRPPFTISNEVLLATITKSKSKVNRQFDLVNVSHDAQQSSSANSQVTVKHCHKVSSGKSSTKSRSVSSKASSQVDLMLQMFEEGRRLREQRDQEYLRQKYVYLQDELESESDDENMYRSDLVNNWVMDQQNKSTGWDQDRVTRRPEQLSSTTKPITKSQPTIASEKFKPHQQIGSSIMNPSTTTGSSSHLTTIPESVLQASGGYGPASNSIGPGMSTIFSVQDNTDTALNEPAFGSSNYLLTGTKNHDSSSTYVNNVTSSSSNAQVLSSDANYPCGSMTNASKNPIMSTYVSGGGLKWNSHAMLNPMSMPHISGGSINNFQQVNDNMLGGLGHPTSQAQIGNINSSSGTYVPVVQSQVNSATGTSGGINTTWVPQINTTSTNGGIGTRVQFPMNTSTSFGGIFNPVSQMNTSSMPNYGRNQNTSVPVVNTSVPVVNTSIPFVNTSVPMVNSNNSGLFNTTYQPQTSFVPPTSMVNRGSNQVVPFGGNFGNFRMPGGFGYQNIATRLKFPGKREDWPLFESEFLTSSELCGYTDVENLSRLRRMLKGKALTSVRSMLQGSMNLQVVLSTLRMLYGKPEAVINELYKKARETEHIRSGKLDLLIEFALTVMNLCGTMVSNGLTHHLHNPTLLLELVSKLPDNLKMEWGAIKRYNPNVNLSDLGNWLYDKAQDASEVTILELKSDTGSDKKGDNKPKSKKDDEPGFLNSHVTTNNVNKGKKNSGQKFDKPASSIGSCPICQNSQCKVIANCSKLKSLSQQERWDKVVENKLCRRCFGQHHHFRCKVQKKCGINNCERLHHNLLHKDTVEGKTDTKGNDSSAIVQQPRLNTHQIHGENTFLPIIPVILSHQGRSVKTYVFFDEGSTITLVETRYSTQLELCGTKRNLCLRWTNGIVHSEKGSMIVSLNISGIKREHSSYQLPVVRTVENLELPEQSIDLEYLTKRYPHLNDIPVDGFNGVKIGILIGGNYAKLALPTDVREGGLDEPVARKTRLGWVISGSHDGESAQGNFVYHHVHECPCQGAHDRDLDKLVTDFFSLENFGVQVSLRSIESKEDQRTRQIIESTTKFLVTDMKLDFYGNTIKLICRTILTWL